MIKNLTVVGFNDFSVGIIDQHICTAHIGPVGSGVRCGQVTQLPLLNVVLIGTVHLWYGVTWFCGVVINSGLSASSLDEPASLEWRGM